MHSCYAEVGTIKQFQKYTEYLRRAGKTRKDVFQNVADLRNFHIEHQLPDSVDEMDPYSMYAPDIDWDSYPGVLALCLICQINVKWIGQLIQAIIRWALHGDGTHKIHIGRWVLMTFGTHVLVWDTVTKAITSSLCMLMLCYALYMRRICTLRTVMLKYAVAMHKYAGNTPLCCVMLFVSLRMLKNLHPCMTRYAYA